jgi:hypothetical protein
LGWSNTPKQNSKGTGMVSKADKGTLRQPQKISTPPFLRVVFFGLPLHLLPPTCGALALCFIAFFVVSWLAGGWSFTFIALPVSISFFLGIPAGSLYGSLGCRSQLVGSHFRGLTFFFLWIPKPKRPNS